MRAWWARRVLARRHKKAPRLTAVDLARNGEGDTIVTYHVLDGVVHIDRIVNSEACNYGSEEWDGYFIGERWCWTHGGHSAPVDLNQPCPRSPLRVTT